MINFTIGPVQSTEEILNLGAVQLPYFRTREFSQLNLENEKMMKQLIEAEETSRVLFLTGSGTAGMEAAVLNLITKEDKILVINGGTFGQRFVDLCEIYELNYVELKLERGKALTRDELKEYDNQGFTVLLINHLETSTGVLYDLNLVGGFCKENQILLVVDAISSFIAEEIKVSDTGIDVLIVGSQKALACPPGVAILNLSERAIKRIQDNKIKSLYLNLKIALTDSLRGQTPFTPAVGILIQINARLKQLCREDMGKNEREKIRLIANDFREKIVKFPFEIYSNSLSNTVTPICVTNNTAHKIFEILKDDYGIWICPNGGELKDKVFRVGHIGALSIEDNNALIVAFEKIQENGLF